MSPLWRRCCLDRLAASSLSAPASWPLSPPLAGHSRAGLPAWPPCSANLAYVQASIGDDSARNRAHMRPCRAPRHEGRRLVRSSGATVSSSVGARARRVWPSVRGSGVGVVLASSWNACGAVAFALSPDGRVDPISHISQFAEREDRRGGLNRGCRIDNTIYFVSTPFFCRELSRPSLRIAK